jgi:hypothetical protein
MRRRSGNVGRWATNATVKVTLENAQAAGFHQMLDSILDMLA